MDNLFEIIVILIVTIPFAIIIAKAQHSNSSTNREYSSELDYMFNFKPKTPEEFTKKAEICLKYYQENDAFENITKAIEMEPSAQRYIISAKIKNSYSFRDSEGALTDLYTAMRLAPNKDELAEIYRQRTDANFALVRTDNLDEKYKEIIEDCNALLEIYPNDEDAYINLGIVYHNLDDNQAAHENYDKALQINDRNHTAYHSKYSLLSEEGKKQEALDYINKAIECSPDNTVMGFTYYERGSLYLELGDYENAIKDLDTYIRKNKEGSFPDSYDTYQKRGTAKENTGDYKGAIADYKKALILIEDEIKKLPENKEKSPAPEEKWDEYEKKLDDDKQELQAAIENLKNIRNV